MTIVAGLRCANGIVLCADTQETKNELSKINVPKLRIEPWFKAGKDSPEELMIAVAGAGDGPFIDKIIERAWEEGDRIRYERNGNIFGFSKELVERIESGPYLPEPRDAVTLSTPQRRQSVPVEVLDEILNSGDSKAYKPPFSNCR